jgi:hypothetical protein
MQDFRTYQKNIKEGDGSSERVSFFPQGFLMLPVERMQTCKRELGIKGGIML